MQAFRDAAEDVLSRHHRAFLGVFKQMMVGVFGPGMEQVFNRASPQGYSMEAGPEVSQFNLLCGLQGDSRSSHPHN
jgi:hypothetical protein